MEMFSIILSKREKEYVSQLLDNNASKFSNDQRYDLNYRLKRKFQMLHDDYWLLVRFFKSFEKNFSLRSTVKTNNVLSLAKSQIANNLSLVNTRCHYCRRTTSDLEKNYLLDLSVCEECYKELGK